MDHSLALQIASFPKNRQHLADANLWQNLLQHLLPGKVAAYPQSTPSRSKLDVGFNRPQHFGQLVSII